MLEEAKQQDVQPVPNLGLGPKITETADQIDLSGNGQPVEPATGSRSPQHAEAGRKGAFRIHELVRLGKLYEQEHGLKRGRQRRRQHPGRDHVPHQLGSPR
jgi:hypothetical protein